MGDSRELQNERPACGSGIQRRVVLIFVFVLCALLTVQNATATTPASITATPNSILSGNTVTISGAGFPANSSILFWLDTNGNGQLDADEPAYPYPLQADAAGSIPAQSWTMIDVPAGALFIQAAVCAAAPVVGLCYGTAGVAQAPMTITMGLSASKFGSGESVEVTGYGLSSGATVNVWYDNDANGTLSDAIASTSPSADSNGAFSTSLLVSGNPGDYYIHSGTSSTATATIPVNIGTCWFQDCTINGADTICLLGNSPTDLQFLGISLADCKQVDSNYTLPTPITANNTPPGGYDLSNVGPVFMGAGVLAAATSDLGPPGTGCVEMTAAIAAASLPPPVGYGNSVPDTASLLAIACGVPPLPPPGLGGYILGVQISGHEVPDGVLISGIVAALGGSAAPPPAQFAVAEAAVAGAIACGYVNYYCNGSDITQTILQNPSLQKQLIPLPYLQPPIAGPPVPNPCAALGVNGKCWGDLIGWAQVACQSTTPDYDSNGVGVCERPDASGNYPQLAVPGTAGPPDNGAAPIKCVTGTVIGLSIGYDGDVSFDLSGPGVMSLVNYHNFQPGPGGSEPPNGIDIEIPVAYRPIFMSTITALRPGMTVNVCGRWVADMHMLWNELHPITSLSIVTPLTVTANDTTQVYGASTPSFSVSYNGFVNGDTASVLGGTLLCTTTATPGSSVGPYPITCSGQTSSSYAISYAPGTLTVTPAALSIAANNATRTYGASNPTFAITPTGLLNGDTLTSIGVNPTCSTTATAGSAVGSYAITCSGPSSTTNYIISYPAGTLTITPATLAIVTNNATRTYGSANPTFTTTPTGLLNGDTLSSIGVSPTCSTTATTGSGVGSYPITCTGPSSTTNYAISYQSGTLNITTAPLTITAKGATKILNAPNPALSATYSGFVNGDTASSLTGTLTCTTTATTTSPVGSYPITCSGQSSNNYNIAYVSGTLKILYASSGLCDGDSGHQILQPINSDGTSVWKQGRTVPAKFRVCDANGVSVGTAGVVSSFMLVQIIGGTMTAVDESVSSTTPDTAFRWDPSALQWIFNISTNGLSAGQTYVYSIALNDGSSITFQYGLR